ncbi:MAG: T9SS type A sorting domain-containing protein [Rhodothermia bacterium]|nr:T9SS type A sorting domain-containing protein [Rhodothermia bacterium]
MKPALFFWLLLAYSVQAQNWIPTSTGLYTGQVSDMVTWPNGRVFVSTTTAGVFSSEDGGSTWRSVNRHLGNRLVQQLDTDSNGVLWAKTGEQDDPTWYTFEVISDTWREVKEWSSPQFKSKNPAITTNGSLLRMNGGRIQHSIDQGQTWQMINRPEGFVVVSAIAEAHGIWLAGTNNGLWRSLDQGQTWQKAALTALESHTFLRDTDGTLLLISKTDGIWRTKNEGSSWEVVSLTISPNVVVHNDQWIVAAPGVFRTSTDRGRTWQNKANFNATVTAFSLERERWLVGTLGQGLWISEDGGRSGRNFSSGQTVTAIAQSGAVLLTAWEAGGLARSTDGGKTWQNPTTPFRFVYELAWITKNRVLAYTSRGTYLSEDSGASWKSAKQGVEPLDARHFYAAPNGQLFAANPSFIWTSSDDGATWTTVTPNTIGATTFVLNKEGFLLAGTETDGVYRLDRALAVTNEAETLPISRRLHNNFPNPFHTATTIQFQLPKNEYVRLQVFDLQGRLITTLHDNFMNAGQHTAKLSAQNLASGTYFLVLQTDEGRETRNVTVAR